jgi:hypothetical protein
MKSSPISDLGQDQQLEHVLDEMVDRENNATDADKPDAQFYAKIARAAYFLMHYRNMPVRVTR